MNYDDWLVEQEHNYRGWNDEDEFECTVCGTPMKKEGGTCSQSCFEADMR